MGDKYNNYSLKYNHPGELSLPFLPAARVEDRKNYHKFNLRHYPALSVKKIEETDLIKYPWSPVAGSLIKKLKSKVKHPKGIILKSSSPSLQKNSFSESSVERSIVESSRISESIPNSPHQNPLLSNIHRPNRRNQHLKCLFCKEECVEHNRDIKHINQSLDPYIAQLGEKKASIYLSELILDFEKMKEYSTNPEFSCGESKTFDQIFQRLLQKQLRLDSFLKSDAIDILKASKIHNAFALFHRKNFKATGDEIKKILKKSWFVKKADGCLPHSSVMKQISEIQNELEMAMNESGTESTASTAAFICTQELIRQITIKCKERGHLLLQALSSFLSEGERKYEKLVEVLLHYISILEQEQVSLLNRVEPIEEVRSILSNIELNEDNLNSHKRLIRELIGAFSSEKTRCWTMQSKAQALKEELDNWVIGHEDLKNSQIIQQKLSEYPKEQIEDMFLLPKHCTKEERLLMLNIERLLWYYFISYFLLEVSRRIGSY